MILSVCEEDIFLTYFKVANTLFYLINASGNSLTLCNLNFDSKFQVFPSHQDRKKSLHLFCGRSYGSKIWFRDLLTFIRFLQLLKKTLSFRGTYTYCMNHHVRYVGQPNCSNPISNK